MRTRCIPLPGLASVLLILGAPLACGDASVPAPPTPRSDAAEPPASDATPRRADDPPPNPSPSPSPTNVAPPRCEGEGLAAFACTHAQLCADVDPWDETVTLPEFLCVARSARAPQGPLRIGDVLRDLPAALRKNFTLKHGTKQRGLRGHPQELMADVVSDALAKRSQSADLDFPRVILWDDATGFTLSYNGGLTAGDGATRSQTGADRLDLMGWDPEQSRFELWALDLPVTEHDPDAPEQWAIAPFQPDHEDDNCTHCHGPRSRPIWPMYPDWPGFYGSDNDELAGPGVHQRTEREFLAYFRTCVASEPAVPIPGDPDPAVDCAALRHAASGGKDTEERAKADLVDTRRRYDTLFADDLAADFRTRLARVDAKAVRTYLEGLDDRFSASTVASIRTPEGLAAVRGDEQQRAVWLGLTLHDTWPYRPNNALQSTEPSRAFFHRPNLRLGVLYNRLVALEVFAALRASEHYARFDRLLALSLMDCGFGDDLRTQVAAVEAWRDAVGPTLTERDLALGAIDAPGYRIPYPALLAGFGQAVRDVDIRYSYPNRRFDRFDRDLHERPMAGNPMQLGYLAYGSRDYNAANGATHYWSSYWDGSATTDELLVALVLRDLAARAPAYAAIWKAHTLTAKYERFVSRHVLDAEFFAHMDGLSGWFPLPYPKRLADVLHRPSFHRKQDGQRVFRTQYEAVCAELRRDLAAQDSGA